MHDARLEVTEGPCGTLWMSAMSCSKTPTLCRRCHAIQRCCHVMQRSCHRCPLSAAWVFPGLRGAVQGRFPGEGAMHYTEAARCYAEKLLCHADKLPEDPYFLGPGSFPVSGERYKAEIPGSFCHKTESHAMLRSCHAMQRSCRTMPTSWGRGLSKF